MEQKKFSRIAESLRKFQRAELKEFAEELGDKPVDAVYVDPLENDAVLDTVLSGNTTFLFGRKGTGKSTIIARAQSNIRDKKNSLSVYLDVKSINESSQTSDVLSKRPDNFDFISEVIQPHLLRKSFLIEVFSRLIDELERICKNTRVIDRFLGKHWKYEDLQHELNELKDEVRKGIMNEFEIPILQSIENEAKNRHHSLNKKEQSAGVNVTAHPALPKGNFNLRSASVEEILDDDELYSKYSSAVLRTFPYQDFIKKLVSLLDELAFSSLVIFFDDFSELNWIEQRKRSI